MRPSVTPFRYRPLSPVTHRTIPQTLTWLGIAVAVLAVTAAPASAQTQSNLVGAYAGTTTQIYVPGNPPRLIVDLTVTGFANPLGPFTAVGQQTVNLLAGTYTGSYTFTVANGDTLTATTDGIRYLCLSSGVYSLEENFTFTGGTGSFSGATGGGSGLGVFGTLDNQIALAFKGTLSTASPSGPNQRK